jgi:mannose-6-phosphate isomerase-like protein (cupin superfamily)
MHEGATMEQFTLAEARRQRTRKNQPYHEFLHVPMMSAGVYELGVGDNDTQQPHTEDELYYIVSGKATLLVGASDLPVEAGSMVFLPAHMVHRFHTITEALTILVFFAPAEYTYRGETQPNE